VARNPTESSPDYPLNIEVEQKEESFSISLVAKPECLVEQDARQLLEIYLRTIRSPEEMSSILPDVFSRLRLSRVPMVF